MSDPVRVEAVGEVAARAPLQDEIAHGHPIATPDGVWPNRQHALDDLDPDLVRVERTGQVAVYAVGVKREVVDLHQGTKCRVEDVMPPDAQRQDEQAGDPVEDRSRGVTAAVAEKLVELSRNPLQQQGQRDGVVAPKLLNDHALERVLVELPRESLGGSARKGLCRTALLQ